MGSVTPGTPIADAGIKTGMVIKSIHGMALAGMTKDSLRKYLSEVKPDAGNVIRLEIMDTPGSEPRTVTIPLSALGIRSDTASTEKPAADTALANTAVVSY